MKIRFVLASAAVVLLAACGEGQTPPPAAPAAEPAHASALVAPPRDPPVEGSSPAAASSPEALTDAAAHFFAAMYPDVSFSIAAPLELRADAGPERHLVVRLDRVWTSCAARPDACEEALRAYARQSGVAFTERPEMARPEQVLPALRPASYLAGTASQPRTGVEPFVAGMVTIYVADSPTHLRSLRQDEIAALGNLKTLARANLARHLGDVSATVDKTPTNTIGALTTNDYFESSRLLEREPWATAAARGPLLATAPANDVVLFAIAPRPETIAKLREATAAIYAKARRPLSTAILAWSADGWRESTP